jgi:hypothetical protein
MAPCSCRRRARNKIAWAASCTSACLNRYSSGAACRAETEARHRSGGRAPIPDPVPAAAPPAGELAASHCADLRDLLGGRPEPILPGDQRGVQGPVTASSAPSRETRSNVRSRNSRGRIPIAHRDALVTGSLEAKRCMARRTRSRTRLPTSSYLQANSVWEDTMKS